MDLERRVKKLETVPAEMCQCGPAWYAEGQERPAEICPKCGRERYIVRLVYDLARPGPDVGEGDGPRE